MPSPSRSQLTSPRRHSPRHCSAAKLRSAQAPADEARRPLSAEPWALASLVPAHPGAAQWPS
eukprot:278201-Prymnesium_polylepis.1